VKRCPAFGSAELGSSSAIALRTVPLERHKVLERHLEGYKEPSERGESSKYGRSEQQLEPLLALFELEASEGWFQQHISLFELLATALLPVLLEADAAYVQPVGLPQA
jgi:hypothetical protein